MENSGCKTKSKSACGNFLSCFPNRTRRCNSETEVSCYRCSGCRQRNRTNTGHFPVGTTARLVNVTVTTPNGNVSPDAPPYISISSSNEFLRRSRHQLEASAPSQGQVLFNSEDRSDVVFLVGRKPDQWRFPGHSFILSPASPVIESIILGRKRVSTDGQESMEQSRDGDQDPNPETGLPDGQATARVYQIEVLDTPPDVFQNILSFIYTNSIPFLNVSSALRLFVGAQRYEVGTLGAACLAFLLESVNEDNATEILSQLQLHRRKPKRSNYSEAGSPVADELCNNLQNEVSIRCLDVIDEFAESVLKMESFENLEQEIVNDILKRDTLRVRSEMTVYDAAMRWACQECKRRQLELLPRNKRECLGKALYSIRFLTMSVQDFERGPVLSGLLPDDEKDALMSRLSGNKSPLPDNLQGRKMDERRPLPKIVCHGAVAKRRPLGRSSSFSAGSSQSMHCTLSSRTLCRKNSSADPKKKSASKKVLQGLEDFVVCMIQLLD